MTNLRFANDETLYAGAIFEMGGDAIVARFYTGVPASMDSSTIDIMEGGTVSKTYTGYNTVCQIDGMDVILTNSGRKLELAYDDADIETLRSSKLAEMGGHCSAAIYYGVDVNGEHYSLEETDQINLQNAYAAVQAGATGYPYHADGQLCRLHTAEEITAIANAATSHKLYHTTYCNHLNTWIKRATSAAELGGIYYGAALPDDLKANMEAIINAASAK